MKQPVKKNGIKKTVPKKNEKGTKKTTPNVIIKKKQHPQYGTSKLEEDFARDFLDKLGLEYTYQFEAKSIGRFYDFLVEKSVIIEIDGDYFHSNPLLYEEKDLNRMQKRNKVIDDIKNRWAVANGFPIIRIWEHDIRKNPKKVMDELKKIFYLENELKPIYRKDVNVSPRKKTKKKK